MAESRSFAGTVSRLPFLRLARLPTTPFSTPHFRLGGLRMSSSFDAVLLQTPSLPPVNRQQRKLDVPSLGRRAFEKSAAGRWKMASRFRTRICRLGFAEGLRAFAFEPAAAAVVVPVCTPFWYP